jgi:hypothetical protein
MAASVRTPIGILSFPVLFSPRPRAPGGEPVYQCSILFDQAAQRHPDYDALRRAVREEIDDKCGPGKSQDRAFVATLRSPFRRCSEKSYKGYEIPDGIFISPWTKTRPGVVDAQRNEIIVPEDIWAGQLARATVSPFFYNTSGNKGVSFALNNLQICRTDGERLDGRRAAKEEFDDYDGPGAAVMADDEVPFWSNVVLLRG